MMMRGGGDFRRQPGPLEGLQSTAEERHFAGSPMSAVVAPGGGLASSLRLQDAAWYPGIGLRSRPIVAGVQHTACQPSRSAAPSRLTRLLW
jgi:hypothetical protein